MARRSQRLRRQKRIERMKAREQEAKLSKVVEDNSVVLERMKHASSACDKILQTINNINEPEETPATKEPTFASTVVVPQLKEEPVETIEEKRDLSKMTKKELLVIANELGCNIKRTSTKATIVKAINEAQ